MTVPSVRMPTKARKEAGAVIVMMAALAGWLSVSAYRADSRHAEQLVDAQAKSLEYQIDSSLRSIDTLLAEAADRIDPRTWTDNELAQWFRIRLADFPEIRCMSVVGKDGLSLGPAITRSGSPSSIVSAVGLEPYQYHRDHPGDHGMHIGDPIFGRRDGQPLVPLTRAFADEKGEFGGYVMMGLDPKFLMRTLNAVLLEDAGAAGIMRSDGIFLARAPWKDEIFGKSVIAGELSGKYLSQSKAGVAHYLSPQDATRKIAGYRTLARYPVAVFVGMTTTTAFADWRFQLYCLVAVFLVCSAALFRAATLLDRREYTRVLLAQKTNELKELSIRDDLTGLLNQRAFYEALRYELTLAEQNRRTVVLVYFDLNEFKQLNDRAGHRVGDALLVQVAEAMRHSMRDGDHCCRYGGDEFCVILPRTEAVQAVQACRRLTAAFDQGLTYGVTFSIGVAETGPEDLAGANDLVRAADALMYGAKRRARVAPGHHIVTQATADSEIAAWQSSGEEGALASVVPPGQHAD